jgi:hypothetical protein
MASQLAETDDAKYMHVGVVGTSGRGEDEPPVSKALFDCMLDETRRILKRECRGTENAVLVSGGSA